MTASQKAELAKLTAGMSARQRRLVTAHAAALSKAKWDWSKIIEFIKKILELFT